MKYYKCDYCDIELLHPHIRLSGIRNPEHASLVVLPIEASISHFCTAKCFYHWADELLDTDLVQSVLNSIGNSWTSYPQKA